MTAGASTIRILRECTPVFAGIVISRMAGGTGTAVLRPGIGNTLVVLPMTPDARQIRVMIARIIGTGRVTVVDWRPASSCMTGIAILCCHKVIA